MARNWLSLLGPRFGKSLVYDDPRTLIADRAMRDERFLSVVSFLDKDKEIQANGWQEFTNADGIFYRDTRSPMMIADAGSVAGTAEAIAYPLNFTAIPAGYLYVGKMNKITLIGKLITAGSSPGTMTWTGRYGTAGGSGDVSLGAGAATGTMTISLTKSMMVEMWTCCRTTGTTGSMVAGGRIAFDSAILAGTAGNITEQIIPSGAITAATIDTTTAKGINLDVTLGSASDNFTAQILIFEALN